MNKLFNRTDLDYIVVSEVSVNDGDVLLLADDVSSMGTSIYQVVRNGGIELTTLDELEAKGLFNRYVKDLISNKLGMQYIGSK